jgi:LacI family transcriptional regulator
MSARVTIKQIAACAGVHFSTVSLALRDDPRIPEATRLRIKTLAKQMGYVPDAGLRALSAYRNTRRPQEVRSGLAYLTDMDATQDDFSTTIRDHARAQAERLGYKLDEFNLRESDSSLTRFQSIWWHRGYRGVLIGPFARPQSVLAGDWSRWACVAFGHSVVAPHFNRAVLNHFHNMLVHLQMLRSKGYRRIGLCLPERLSERTEGQLHAAYLLDQTKNGEAAPIPLLADADDDADQLENWIRRERLDVVIAHPRQHQLLVGRGWRFPEQLGFSLLTLKRYQTPADDTTLAGFDTKAEVLAAGAVNFLVSLIHEQATGLLNPPRYYMIAGDFVDGNSLHKCLN